MLETGKKLRTRMALCAALLTSSAGAGCTPVKDQQQLTTVQTDMREQPSLPKLPLLDTFTEYDLAMQPVEDQSDNVLLERALSNARLIKIQSATRTFSCVGSPIGPYTFVTAAHCIYDISQTELRVSIYDSPTQITTISDASILNDADIAILTTNQTHQIEPLSIHPTANLDIGAPLFIHTVEPIEGGSDSRIFAGRYIGRAINIDVGLTDQELQDYFLIILDSGVLETGFSGSGITDNQGHLVGLLNAIGQISLNNQSYFAGLAIRSELIELVTKAKR